MTILYRFYKGILWRKYFRPWLRYSKSELSEAVIFQRWLCHLWLPWHCCGHRWQVSTFLVLPTSKSEIGTVDNWLFFQEAPNFPLTFVEELYIYPDVLLQSSKQTKEKRAPDHQRIEAAPFRRSKELLSKGSLLLTSWDKQWNRNWWALSVLRGRMLLLFLSFTHLRG